MSKVLMESLKMDLPALAELLRSKGRGKDSVLAHITPKEAALLKKRGGRGSKNPETGLLEFDEAPIEQAGPTYQEMQYTPPPEQATQAPATVDQLQAGGYNVLTPQQQAFAETQRQEDFSATPKNPYTDTSLYPGGQQPTGVQTVFTPQGLTYNQTPGQLQAAAPTAPTADTGTPKQPPSFTDKLGTALTDPNNLLRLGLATGLGVFGAGQARKSAGQQAAATGQQQAIAQPYQTQGQQLVTQAQAGQLSATSQAALNAAKAQSAQNVANRGGVGAEAEANKIATLTQQLLNNQYTYGLNVMQIGDNISLGAIKSGLQLDTQLNQATTNFYTQLAGIVGGGSSFGGGQTVTLRTA